jgi:predicted amidohydrolase YtcJ
MRIDAQLANFVKAAVVVTLVSACSADKGADLIFHNGSVLTVNSSDEVSEALAVRDGLIIAVGTSKDVLSLRADATEVIDLNGRTLTPGFIASHEHPTLSAVFNGAVDLSGFTHKTNADVWRDLRAAVGKAPKGEWIYFSGLDAILTPDLKIPTRLQLDDIAPDNPVVLVSQTLHSFWANSKAFEAAGITKTTPDPGNGSYYERDKQGELTGFVAETRAGAPLLNEMKSPWKIFGRYEKVLNELLASGFTSVASVGYNLPPLMARFAASEKLQPRIRQFFYMVEDELNYLPDRPDTSNPFFQVLGVKLWHDGSPYTGSMLTTAPYLETPLAKTLGIPPGGHGAAIIPDQALVEKIQKYSRQGWQVSIHSQGDASNRMVVKAVEASGPLAGDAPVVRMEHGVFMPLDGLPTMAKKAISPSFHIHHILYYGDALEDSIIGSLMVQQTLPVKAAFEHGLRPTLHADTPMFPAKPFRLMQTAMNRETSSGRKFNVGQGIDIRQAMRAMTINGAYQLRIEKNTGSLENGKWADLQILDRNPYVTPVQELDRLQVQAVYVAGRLKYSGKQ